ncbi:hypothetical protein H072_10913 [Dactylellina haptotyla CBS 200.50]|uniref:Uncharacterized protein n=1 Tax=Dactylellina haptotyla (strain CBS 200.50) TaxID=1284197 RepID=S7ZYY5_DACHA|nr:hypothetical protein H072_10913 [Dactylellina haptotyla CBS 200.50]
MAPGGFLYSPVAPDFVVSTQQAENTAANEDSVILPDEISRESGNDTYIHEQRDRHREAYTPNTISTFGKLTSRSTLNSAIPQQPSVDNGTQYSFPENARIHGRHFDEISQDIDVSTDNRRFQQASRNSSSLMTTDATDEPTSIDEGCRLPHSAISYVASTRPGEWGLFHFGGEETPLKEPTGIFSPRKVIHPRAANHILPKLEKEGNHPSAGEQDGSDNDGYDGGAELPLDENTHPQGYTPDLTDEPGRRKFSLQRPSGSLSSSLRSENGKNAIYRRASSNILSFSNTVLGCRENILAAQQKSPGFDTPDRILENTNKISSPQDSTSKLVQRSSYSIVHNNADSTSACHALFAPAKPGSLLPYHHSALWSRSLQASDADESTFADAWAKESVLYESFSSDSQESRSIDIGSPQSINPVRLAPKVPPRMTTKSYRHLKVIEDDDLKSRPWFKGTPRVRKRSSRDGRAQENYSTSKRSDDGECLSPCREQFLRKFKSLELGDLKKFTATEERKALELLCDVGNIKLGEISSAQELRRALDQKSSTNSDDFMDVLDEIEERHIELQKEKSYFIREFEQEEEDGSDYDTYVAKLVPPIPCTPGDIPGFVYLGSRWEDQVDEYLAMGPRPPVYWWTGVKSTDDEHINLDLSYKLLELETKWEESSSGQYLADINDSDTSSDDSEEEISWASNLLNPRLMLTCNSVHGSNVDLTFDPEELDVPTLDFERHFAKMDCKLNHQYPNNDTIHKFNQLGQITISKPPPRDKKKIPKSCLKNLQPKESSKNNKDDKSTRSKRNRDRKHVAFNLSEDDAGYADTFHPRGVRWCTRVLKVFKRDDQVKRGWHDVLPSVRAGFTRIKGFEKYYPRFLQPPKGTHMTQTKSKETAYFMNHIARFKLGFPPSRSSGEDTYTTPSIRVTLEKILKRRERAKSRSGQGQGKDIYRYDIFTRVVSGRMKRVGMVDLGIDDVSDDAAGASSHRATMKGKEPGEYLVYAGAHVYSLMDVGEGEGGADV